MLNVSPVKYKTFTARTFSHAAATLRNELPKNFRESKTLDKFKELLKTHLYKKLSTNKVCTHYSLVHIKCM